MVEHIQLHPEEFAAVSLAGPPNPLREQYAQSMTTGGGGPETVQTPGTGTILNADGTMNVPALNTSTRPGDASTRTNTLGTTDNTGSQTAATGNDQVTREYNAGLAMMQNPNGGSQQLLQTLSQFGPTAGSDPGYKSWLAGYTPDQVKAAYIQAQLAAGPMVGLWARLNQTQPGVSQAIDKVTQQYNQQVEAAGGAGGGFGPSTTTPTDQQTDPTASQADPTDTTAGDALQQPDTQSQETQGQVKPAVLRRSTSAAAPDLLAQAKQNFMTQEGSDWNTQASSRNSDCGPTSLAMAYKQLGIKTPGLNPQGAENLITDVRRSMTSRTNHTEVTDMGEIRDAAVNQGVPTNVVAGLDGINTALANGGVVISPGNPAYGWGPRLGSNYETSDNGQSWSGAHIILINGIDKNTGNYIVSDPLSKAGVIEVTPKEMQGYINTSQSAPGDPPMHGGVALYRPTSLPSTMTA